MNSKELLSGLEWLARGLSGGRRTGRPHELHTASAAWGAGAAGDVTSGLDTRPIRGVAFVKLANLTSLGFGERFAELARAGFPGAGSYMGTKASIGL